MALWKKKVVFKARRAWAAVSGRLLGAPKTGNGGILKLHEDVQTCGYQDVQVMFDMLTSELEAAHVRKQQPSPPPAWPGRSSSSSLTGSVQ
ncbi:uncharacterized protein LOC100845602 [Brachypodium distachyon]|uniref:Uncharacterized protein n=1 Tax=Brachypodium distachyon TaxID=15368 RepID=I1I278_BRADI|nr:uncharacterized protein LOC100845602 [Brachypodium distachyon]KQJ95726.1 hypothetical protein BRADI_3g18730v3 [Brachypodium distachyon]|eukprot:XP_003571570.1 uncharacterized protein LOC100845602 [Brachypodium distachyon]